MASSATPRVGARRWRIGVLLGMGVLINYIDRISLSVAAPQVQENFHLGAVQLFSLAAG